MLNGGGSVGRRGLESGALLLLGAGLSTSMPSSVVAAPVLTSLDFDLADTAGGDSVTITGTNLGSATTCMVGTSSATIVSNTPTSLTFTMPAKAAGTYNVQVTTIAGASNMLSIAVEAGPIVYLSADRATAISGSLVSGIPNSAAGAPVDLSVSQANAAKRPTYDAANAALNGQKAITQAPGLGVLCLDASPLTSNIAQPITVYAAFYMSGTGAIFVCDGASNTSRVAILCNGGGQPWGYAGAGVIDGPAITNHPVVGCFVFNDMSSAGYLNDAGTPALSGPFGTNALHDLRVGGNYDETIGFVGAWSVLGIFDGAHDATARERNMARLRAKYLASDNVTNIAHDGLWLANFSASPWTSWPSVGGTSAGKTLTEATNPPAAGAAVNGFTPADFDGINDWLALSGTAFANYVGVSAYSGWALVYVDSISTDDAAPYNNVAILTTNTADSARWSIYLRSSGLVGLHHYDALGVGHQTVTTAIITGAWQLVQWRYDGANMQIRVNGGAWQSHAAGSVVYSVDPGIQLGRNYFNSIYLDGKTFGVGLRKAYWNDATFDSIRAGLSARFGLSL